MPGDDVWEGGAMVNAAWDYDRGINEYIAELEERAEAQQADLAEVCARLAHAHDALIAVARRLHREARHCAPKWTECDQWPCRDIGREITRKGW